MTASGLVGLLRELVEIESPTRSRGVQQVSARLAGELERLGAETRFLEGGHLRAELDGSGPPLLLVGHADTVWPLGTLARMPFRVDGDVASGPGVYDMKGGLVVLVEAVRRSAGERRPVRVFVTADEEVGSPTARPHLEEAAEGVAAAFVVEPAGPTGNLKTARKGLGRFRLTLTGRAAHAGRPIEGASAIHELAHQIQALRELADARRGTSVNVGVVSGGTTENVVAAEAEAYVDVRVPDWAERERLDRALAGLEPVDPEVTLELGGGWTRPPLERSDGAAKLFARAREHARELGLELGEEGAGGGSDGNLLAAFGVPVLDGLGPLGGGAHAEDEHVSLPSLPLRAEVLARLLRDPGLP